MLDFLGPGFLRANNSISPVDSYVSRELVNVTARGEEVKYLFVKEQESATFCLWNVPRPFRISNLAGKGLRSSCGRGRIGRHGSFSGSRQTYVRFRAAESVSGRN
jgi:hypothetical protein